MAELDRVDAMLAREDDEADGDSSSTNASPLEDDGGHHVAAEPLVSPALRRHSPEPVPMEICIHEAGHALAHWYVGVPFIEARVCVDGDPSGIDAVVTGFELAPPRAHWLALAAAGDETALARGRAVTEMEMFCAYAGPFAEGRYVPPPVRFGRGEKPSPQSRLHPDVNLFGGGGGAGDWTLIEEGVREWPDGVALAVTARRLTEAFVRGHTAWTTIAAVARRLRRQRVLTWSEVAALASEGFGRERPKQADWIPHWPPLAVVARGGFLPPQQAGEPRSDQPPSASNLHRGEQPLFACLA